MLTDENCGKHRKAPHGAGETEPNGRRESSNRKKAEGNTKNGNRYPACVFVDAVNFAIRS
jgi:hypothetical protein